MTENNESPTSRVSAWTLKEALQAVPLLAIGITTICFVLGLVIVNLHLAKYGIHSPEFIRSEFVLVGVAFITLILLTSIMFEYAILGCVRKQSLWKEKGKLRLVFEYLETVILLFAALEFTLYGLFSIGRTDFNFWKIVVPTTLILLTGIGLNFAGKYIYKLAKRIETEETKRIKTVISGIYHVLLYFPLTIVWISGYSYWVYPQLSSAIGGGYRSPVILTPTARGLEVSKSLALPLQNNPTMVGPIQVLTESEKELVVLIPDSLTGKWRTVRLNRDLFDAVQTAASTL